MFSGACLIDRDGSLFKYLLDYLHGEVRIPEDKQIRIALQEEADYFGIPYPYSLSDHLANEMETYSLRSNVELKKVCISLIFVKLYSFKDVSHHLLAADTTTMYVRVSTFLLPLQIIENFRINSRTDNTVIVIKYSAFPPLQYSSSLKLTLLRASLL